MGTVRDDVGDALRRATRLEVEPELLFLLHMRVRRTERALELYDRASASLARQVRMLQTRIRRYGG